MKLVAPDYYPDFKCVAGRCHHSCCLGWEIDIDKEKLKEYQSCPGPMGDKLRANIELTLEDEEAPAHFKLLEGERCPFLNEKNLCELILTLGEDSLCQICTDHPRFRNYWSDFTEIGLGMACEEVARIILSKESKMKLIILEDDEEDNLNAANTEEFKFENSDLQEDDMELEYLSLRKNLMEILQDRNVTTDERVVRMLKHCGIETDDIKFKDGPLNEIACEQLAVYLLYRNFADVLYDGRLEDRIRFVAKSYMSIRNEWAENGSTELEMLIKLARKFSEDVEYDTDTWMQ